MTREAYEKVMAFINEVKQAEKEQAKPVSPKEAPPSPKLESPNDLPP
jgi:hypothetical protein